MELLSKLSKLDLVKGLPVTKFVKNKICDRCQLGKQNKSTFKKKKEVISTLRPLELLHMDLFGPIRTTSLSGKLYAFVIVMIILTIHGYYLLLTKMKLIKYLLNIVEEFKMKKVLHVENLTQHYF